MDEDWALILPAALRFGATCWALGWYGLLRRLISGRQLR